MLGELKPKGPKGPSIKADLGSVRGRARAHLGSLKHPNRATLYLLYTSLCMES